MNIMSRRGYTIDQTILIIAIIAILITLVIVTLGWTLLSRTSGSKLGTFTDQMEQAINTYYGVKHTFPADIAALNTEGLIKFRNASGTYYHDIGGSTGVVTLTSGTVNETSYNIGASTSKNHMIVQFTSVPAGEANEALKAINGDASNKGRLTANVSTGCTDTNMAAKAGVSATATGIVCFIAQATN